MTPEEKQEIIRTTILTLDEHCKDMVHELARINARLNGVYAQLEKSKEIKKTGQWPKRNNQ